MKNSKSNLDEMQEAKLLKIEHNGCWLAFWGLLTVMIVELFVFDAEEVVRAAAGEWIVFMVLSVYIGAACLKNGIWDRHLKANAKTNLLISLIAAVAAGLIVGGVLYSRYQIFEDAAITFISTTVVCFVLCFAALSISARIMKKKLEALESETDEQDSENT